MARIDIDTVGSAHIIAKGVKDALLPIMKDIAIASQAEVPIDTGDLLNSIRLTETETGYVLSYSSILEDGTDNAIVQHEDTTINHPRGGKAGYLRDPALRIAGRLPEELARRLKL